MRLRMKLLHQDAETSGGLKRLEIAKASLRQASRHALGWPISLQKLQNGF
jgi:hypothetical protein